MVLLVVSAVAAMVAMVYASHSLRVFLDGFRLMFDDTWSRVQAGSEPTMINFRFHLVSLIAVFLALGLGILVGSTVVDQVIVDRLDREIRSVRHDSSAVKSANNTLKDQVSQLEDYLAKSSSYIVEGRLTADPVAVVADKGVSTGTVKATVDMLREAGAEVPGVLWLDEKWSLDNSKDLQALADATDASGNASQVRTAAVRQVVQRLATLPKAGRRKPPPDVIAKLRSNGFLTFSNGSTASLADFPASSPRVLVVTGTDSRLSSTPTIVEPRERAGGGEDPDRCGRGVRPGRLGIGAFASTRRLAATRPEQRGARQDRLHRRRRRDVARPGRDDACARTGRRRPGRPLRLRHRRRRAPAG